MSDQRPVESLVITASGPDQVGLVEKFSGRITDAGCNIEESRMAVLGGQFALVMRVMGNWDALARLEGQLAGVGRDLGLTIVHNRTRSRERKEPLVPYQVDVVSLDHPGIVHSLSRFFSRHGINIEEMQTDSYAAPHTGTPMFSVSMIVGVPASVHVATLREDFMDHCDELNLDATIEPVRA